MVLILLPTKNRKRESPDDEDPLEAGEHPDASSSPETLDRSTSPVCVVCLESGDISGQCEVLLLPKSGATAKSKISQWERDYCPPKMRRPGGSVIFDLSVDAADADRDDGLPLCRSCVNLVSEMDKLEFDLRHLFARFWTVVARRRDVKLDASEPFVRLRRLSPRELMPSVEESEASRNRRELGARTVSPDIGKMDLCEVKIEVPSPTPDPTRTRTDELQPESTEDPSAEDSDPSNDPVLAAAGVEDEEVDDDDDDWTPTEREPREETKKHSEGLDLSRFQDSDDEDPKSAKREVKRRDRSKNVFCEGCGRGFVNSLGLKQHRRKRFCKALKDGSVTEESAEPVGNAPPADTSAPSDGSGPPHQSTKTKKSVSCETCSKTYRDMWALKQHMRSSKHGDMSKLPKADRTKDKTISTCDVCGEVFARYSGLTTHLRFVHKIDNLHAKNGVWLTTFKCEICSEVFDGKEKLDKHEQEAHVADMKFPCPHCDRKFLTKRKLGRHKTTHESVICPICGLTLNGGSLKGRLRAHIAKKHNNEKVLKCKECGEGFRYEQKLWRHQWKEHGMRKDRFEFPCPICGRVLDCKRSLKMHKYSKHGIHEEGLEVHTCHHCGKTFAKKEALTHHLRIHDDVKPHVCPEPGCHYRSSVFTTLKSHMRKAHNRNVRRTFPEGVRDDLIYTMVDVEEESEPAGERGQAEPGPSSDF